MTYSGKYAAEINAAAKSSGLDPLLIAAVIQVESNWNPKARSGAGAEGLMQLMPGTARELGVTNPFDVQQNINGGSKYLARQIQTFGSIELGLAAYNAGAGNVRKHGGIPPFTETKNYVKKVTAIYTGKTAATNPKTAAESKIESFISGFTLSPMMVFIMAAVFIISRR